MLFAAAEKRLAVRFDEAAMQLGDELSTVLTKLPLHIRESAYEIRIRCGQPVSVASTDGVYFPDVSHIISRREMDDIFSRMCGNAIYSRQHEIASGCITLTGGHRAGICGRLTGQHGIGQTFTEISSVCIRIAHEIIGCADSLVFAFRKKGHGMLIAGPPCSGKTTLLRDMARSLSENSNVAIIDERNEIAAVYRGMPQMDIGRRSDVLTGHAKADGMLHAVRCLSPDVLICDEIGSADEAQAVRIACNSGASVIAAVHCGSAQELKRREQFRLLRESGAFSSVAILSKAAPGKIEYIKDIDEI